VPQPLIGGEGSAEQFRRAAAVARTTPVYQLEVVRSFERLPDAVELILGWHRVAVA
jgi:hypothetical protein